MNPVAFAAGAAVSAVLFAPTAVFFVECALGALPPRKLPRPSGPRPRMAVVVPAHDEETGIAATLRSLLEDVAEGDRLLVVADNCTDDTAGVARRAGAEVVERRDPARRGKGYALSFALDVLSASPPDVVVIVDADCRVEKGALARIAALAVEMHRPVQAEYLLEAPEGASPKTRVSAFALVVRNSVRPRGLLRLGLPCQLTGSGMAFPWDVIRKAAPPGGDVVEDLALGLDLAEKGYGAIFCPDARVRSALPTSDHAAATQRTRWETGQLSTLLRTAPRLVGRGLASGNWGLVALGLDLAVPPLSLLVSLVGGGMAVSVGTGVLGGGPLPLVAVTTEAGFLVLGVLASWVAAGRRVLPVGDVLTIPRYVLWKMPLYGGFLRRGGEREWIRTGRDSS